VKRFISILFLLAACWLAYGQTWSGGWSRSSSGSDALVPDRSHIVTTSGNSGSTALTTGIYSNIYEACTTWYNLRTQCSLFVGSNYVKLLYNQSGTGFPLRRSLGGRIIDTLTSPPALFKSAGNSSFNAIGTGSTRYPVLDILYWVNDSVFLAADTVLSTRITSSVRKEIYIYPASSQNPATVSIYAKSDGSAYSLTTGCELHPGSRYICPPILIQGCANSSGQYPQINNPPTDPIIFTVGTTITSALPVTFRNLMLRSDMIQGAHDPCLFGAGIWMIDNVYINFTNGDSTAPAIEFKTGVVQAEWRNSLTIQNSVISTDSGSYGGRGVYSVWAYSGKVKFNSRGNVYSISGPLARVIHLANSVLWTDSLRFTEDRIYIKSSIDSLVSVVSAQAQDSIIMRGCEIRRANSSVNAARSNFYVGTGAGTIDGVYKTTGMFRLDSNRTFDSTNTTAYPELSNLPQ